MVLIKGAIQVNTISVSDTCGKYMHHRKSHYFDGLVSALKKFPSLGDSSQYVFFPEEQIFESWDRFHFEICDEHRHSHSSCSNCPLALAKENCHADQL